MPHEFVEAGHVEFDVGLHKRANFGERRRSAARVAGDGGQKVSSLSAANYWGVHSTPPLDRREACCLARRVFRTGWGRERAGRTAERANDFRGSPNMHLSPHIDCVYGLIQPTFIVMGEHGKPVAHSPSTHKVLD